MTSLFPPGYKKNARVLISFLKLFKKNHRYSPIQWMKKTVVLKIVAHITFHARSVMFKRCVDLFLLGNMKENRTHARASFQTHTRISKQTFIHRHTYTYIFFCCDLYIASFFLNRRNFFFLLHLAFIFNVVWILLNIIVFFLSDSMYFSSFHLLPPAVQSFTTLLSIFFSPNFSADLIPAAGDGGDGGAATAGVCWRCCCLAFFCVPYFAHTVLNK